MSEAAHPTPWAIEQVLALAPRPTSVAAAQPLAVPGRWAATGCDHRAVWGRCIGSSAEPYDTVIDHVGVASRCTCASRVFPCKHALALLLLWARGLVPHGSPPAAAAAWLARRTAAEQAGDPPGAEAAAAAPASPVRDGPPPAPASPPSDPGSARDERVARMRAGLVELDRWLDDRVRTGLADPSLARYATWDGLAARLVDAQVGGLANRVRRLAGTVGAHSQWHEQVLAELGVLHLLASAGMGLRELPPGLADSVALAIGWQVRQADVLAGVPDTDHWQVMGRSDVREDRIEVRRVWLRGRDSGRWAMVLSFAAYRQPLDESLVVGTEVHADLFRYPGALGLRSLVGRRHGEATAVRQVPVGTVRQACEEVGDALVAEPWIERFPVTMVASPARAGGAPFATAGGDAGWVLTDHTGSVPIAPGRSVGVLLACSAGAPVGVTCEWTPAGMVPLTAHLVDRAVDIGPTADPSFVASDAGRAS